LLEIILEKCRIQIVERLVEPVVESLRLARSGSPNEPT